MRSTLLTIVLLCSILECVTSAPNYSFNSISRRISRPYHYRSSLKKRNPEANFLSKLAERVAEKHRQTKLKELMESVDTGSYKVSKADADKFMRDHVSGPNAGFKVEVKTYPPVYVPKHKSHYTNSRIANYNAQLIAAITKAKACKELQMKLLKLNTRVKVIC